MRLRWALCACTQCPDVLLVHDTASVLIYKHIFIQWNPSCEATTFASEKWPFKRVGLSSGVEINTFMFRFTLSSGLSRGAGLSSGWPLKRGSTVYTSHVVLLILVLLAVFQLRSSHRLCVWMTRRSSLRSGTQRVKSATTASLPCTTAAHRQPLSSTILLIR